MNVIILAGKDIPSKKELRRQREILQKAYPNEHYFSVEEDYKALFKINGQPMIQYVIDACRDSSYIEKIFVVGNKSRLENRLNDCFVIDNKESVVKNAQKGYYESNSEGYALFLSCDIPLIKKEHIDKFIEKCLEYDNGLFVSIIEQKYLAGYEIQNRKYFLLKEGNYRWANIFLGNPEKLNLNRLNRIVDIVYRNRKLLSPAMRWNLIRDLGKELPFTEIFSKVVRYFVSSHFLKKRKLSISEIEKMAADYLDLDLKAIEIRHYEPSLDVDSQEDLDYVRGLMLKKMPCPGFEPGSQP
jgi:hypothetical protein